MPKLKKPAKIVHVKESTSAPQNFEFGREMDRKDPKADYTENKGNNTNTHK